MKGKEMTIPSLLKKNWNEGGGGGYRRVENRWLLGEGFGEI